MELLVFAAVFMIVILAAFVPTFVAVAGEERRVQASYRQRHTPEEAVEPPFASPRPTIAGAAREPAAPAPRARPTHFVPLG